MNEQRTHYEYVYSPEPSAGMTAARIGLIAMYTLFCTIYILLFWIAIEVLALLILLPFLMYAMIRMTWRLVSTEYEISVEAGEFIVAIIYGRASRRSKFRYNLKEITVITPCDDAHKYIIDGAGVTEFRKFGKGMGSDGAWCCVCPDQKKNSRVGIIFGADDELIKMMRLSNPSALKK